MKECREKAKEANQLLHEIQEERIKQEKLEGIMREAASILRPVLVKTQSSAAAPPAGSEAVKPRSVFALEHAVLTRGKGITGS